MFAPDPQGGPSRPNMVLGPWERPLWVSASKLTWFPRCLWKVYSQNWKIFILVNLALSGSSCALKGAPGSFWALLKMQFLVYNPRRRLGRVRVPGWSEDINNLLHSLSCRPEFSQLFQVILHDDGAWQPNEQPLLWGEGISDPTGFWMRIHFETQISILLP